MSILEGLIEQSKRPDKLIGKIMLKIMNKVHAAMTQVALSKLRIHSNSFILDIGCGGGETIRLLTKKATQGVVYGLDFSETSVEMSIQRNINSVDSGKAIITKGEVSSLPFENHFFDIVTAIQTHYYWPDLENDVKEVYRVLKPNGEFIIASEIYKIQYHMTSYKTTKEMELLFNNIGFEVKVEDHNKWRYVIGRKK